MALSNSNRIPANVVPNNTINITPNNGAPSNAVVGASDNGASNANDDAADMPTDTAAQDIEEITDITEPKGELDWTAEEEIQLFFALDGLKPVGIDRNFKMICIKSKMCKAIKRNVSSEAIWTHLRTLYNLDILDELEPLPFPNKQKDFDLPESEFSELMKTPTELRHNPIKSEPETPATPVAQPPTKPKSTPQTPAGHSKQAQAKDSDKKSSAKNVAHTDFAKRNLKRTRGSASLDSPSTTPPPSNNVNVKRTRN